MIVAVTFLGAQGECRKCTPFFIEGGGRDYSIAPGLWRSLKGLELLLSVPIKAIPLKVFVRWGAGKKNFFQKGLFPA